MSDYTSSSDEDNNTEPCAYENDCEEDGKHICIDCDKLFCNDHIKGQVCIHCIEARCFDCLEKKSKLHECKICKHVFCSLCIDNNVYLCETCFKNETAEYVHRMKHRNIDPCICTTCSNKTLPFGNIYRLHCDFCIKPCCWNHIINKICYHGDKHKYSMCSECELLNIIKRCSRCHTKICPKCMHSIYDSNETYELCDECYFK